MTEREQRLKKCKIQNLIGLALLLVGVVLFGCGFAMAEKPFADELAVIGVFGAIAGIVFLVIGTQKAGRVKRSFCPECSRKYDYEDDVSWEELDERTESSSDGSGRLISNVEINCLCENCGNSITFTKKFTIARVDKNGRVQRYNLGSQIRKFFIK